MNHFRNDTDVRMTRNQIDAIVTKFRQVYAADNSAPFADGYLQSLLVTLIGDADTYTQRGIMNRLKDHIADPMLGVSRRG